VAKSTNVARSTDLAESASVARSKGLSVTLSARTPLCPYGIAYWSMADPLPGCAKKSFAVWIFSKQ